MKIFNTIPEILEDIKLGKMVIMLDDYDRENEGDFVMAAEAVTAESINFMATHGRGLICTPISSEMAQQLNFHPMVQSNTATHETAFTVSIDAKKGISTGISARDRAHTIKLMMDDKSVAEDFSRPGHIFPLIASDGGVLKRRGHTEAAIELASLAGFKPGGVICEILRDDGEQARGEELFALAKRFNLKIGTIHDLAIHVEKNAKELLPKTEAITEVSCVDFPNKYGNFKLSLFRSSQFPGEEHLAIHLGKFNSHSVEPLKTLVRLHSECFTGDIFGSLRCDCGDQLELAMKKIANRGHGILIYLKQEGRGIGLSEKLRAYALQEKGMDTVEANLELGYPADSRRYEFAGLILNYFKVTEVELLTNNPTKWEALDQLGFQVSRTPIISHTNSFNHRYLETKKEKMGHLFN
jgi:3,4-dihydroxy 2-butanone 4-phosphate synthase / GTP cyclohydrolase II